MNRRAMRRARGVAIGALLLVAACSDSDLPMGAAAPMPAASGQTNPDPEVPPAREAATADNWTIAAEQGGNGRPTDRKTETDCFTGLYETNHMTCMVVRNATIRLTGEPGITSNRFPLTVSRYITANANRYLKGDRSGSYDGSVAVSDSQDWDCRGACAGRLTPNPFVDSAIMQFQNWSGTRGVRSRIFVGSDVSPMGLVQRAAEMDYDNPMWSKTNYSECVNGDYFACRTVSAPSSGGRATAVYEVSTRPMEVNLVFTAAPVYTLVRQGYPDTTGFMLDPAIESRNATRLPARETARYAGYRSVGDQAEATLKVLYMVGNADGVTDRTRCESAATRVLGCGTRVLVEVVVDKTGAMVADRTRCSAINLTSQTKFSCVVGTPRGSNDGLLTVNVEISDVPIR